MRNLRSGPRSIEGRPVRMRRWQTAVFAGVAVAAGLLAMAPFAGLIALARDDTGDQPLHRRISVRPMSAMGLGRVKTLEGLWCIAIWASLARGEATSVLARGLAAIHKMLVAGFLGHRCRQSFQNPSKQQRLPGRSRRARRRSGCGGLAC